jgi:hypothetical protein
MSGQNVRDNVARRLAAEWGVNERQVRRYSEFATAMDTVCEFFGLGNAATFLLKPLQIPQRTIVELAQQVRSGRLTGADRDRLAEALQHRDKRQVHALMAKRPSRRPLRREELRQLVGEVQLALDNGDIEAAKDSLSILWDRLEEEGRGHGAGD